MQGCTKARHHPLIGHLSGGDYRCHFIASCVQFCACSAWFGLFCSSCCLSICVSLHKIIHFQNVLAHSPVTPFCRPRSKPSHVSLITTRDQNGSTAEANQNQAVAAAANQNEAAAATAGGAVAKRDSDLSAALASLQFRGQWSYVLWSTSGGAALEYRLVRQKAQVRGAAKIM